MLRPTLSTIEQPTQLPTLVIDREGSIGLGICTKLQQHTQCVLVCRRAVSADPNILHIPFIKRIPGIPEDAYARIFFIPQSEGELFDVLPACLKKSEENNAKLIVVLPLKFLSQKTLHFFEDKKVFLAVVGDIFGNPFSSVVRNPVQKLMVAAKVKNSLKLSAMGLTFVHPAEFTDVVTEIVKIALSDMSFAKPFFLFPQTVYTQLRIAHQLQKIDPLITIDFLKDEGVEEEKEIDVQGVYVFAPSYPVLEKIVQVYKNNLPIEDVAYAKLQAEYTNPSVKKSFLLSASVFLLMLFFLPICITGVFGFIGRWALVSIAKDFQKGSIKHLPLELNTAVISFWIADKTAPVVNWETGFIGLQDFGQQLQTGILLGKKLSTILIEITQVSQSFSTINASKITQMVVDSKKAAVMIEAIMPTVSINPQIGPFINTLDFLPEILGIYGKKTYLVLLQNNTELRPGGGFIGSYALVTIHTGKIEDFSIHDVYDADGQLKGHIEPPFAIRRYLPSVHLYLRDSNFSPDFTTDAFLAATIFKEETGNVVDGVVGVDLSFVKSLLQQTGSIYLPEYNQTVTPDNFFALTEAHAEKNFFPGSTQKKDFLKSLFAALQQKIQSQKELSLAMLFSSVAHNFLEKHILLAFSNPVVGEPFIVNGLSGSLADVRQDNSQTVNDFLGISEANVGVNKVNYSINRNVSQEVSITNEGSVSGKTSIVYTNSSSNDWPGGTYKNYLRFFLPLGAHVDSIAIDGQEQTIVPAVTNPLVYEAKDFIPPVGLEVEQAIESGKTAYGFLVMIEVGKKRTIAISYTLNKKIDLSSPVINYNVLVIKQQGTDKYPFSFSLHFPDSLVLLQGKNIVQKDLLSDFVIQLTLRKK